MFLSVVTAGSVVAGALGENAGTLLNGALSEIVSLLPIVLPVVIGFAAIRKGIGFIMGILHAA